MFRVRQPKLQTGVGRPELERRRNHHRPKPIERKPIQSLVLSPQKAEEYLNAIRTELTKEGSELNRLKFDVLSEKSIKTIQ